MIFGHVVFLGKTCAVLKEYTRNNTEHNQHIIFAHALTTDVAFYVLNNSVCGIITEESSFATHGANILRCFYTNSKKELVWVSGVKYSEIVGLIGKKILITSDGQVRISNNSDYIYSQEESIINKVSYVPLNKRSIVKYNISDSSYTICYWPHRQYNTLTFSIMIEGFKKNFNLIGMNPPHIFIDTNGNIWFDNAPLISELVEMAKNQKFAFPLLKKQIKKYSDIYTFLKRDYNFFDLVEMLIDYFSVFILFHDTYEYVLLEADLFFKKYFEESIKYQIMNLLMSCKIDEWMLNNNILLEKNKNLLSSEKITPLPNFTINSDIDYCINRFKKFFVDLEYEKFWTNNIHQLNFYINFFVAKEWKFVMNKILFTRFSDSIQKFFSEISFDELSLKKITEVKKLIEERY